MYCRYTFGTIHSSVLWMEVQVNSTVSFIRSVLYQWFHSVSVNAKS